MEALFGELNKVMDEGTVTQRTHSALWALNRFLAVTRYLVAPQEHVLNKGGTLLVCQRHGQDRYKLDSGCAYDDETAVSDEVWANRNVGIFEHIGLKSGGAEYYDPMFWTRCPSSATEFFTVGRVFMMLWDVHALGRDFQEVVDDDPTVYTNRRTLMTIESAYSGPYTGPGTVRRFVVVAEGVRSSYCLPLSSFNNQGCSQQLDQQNYGVISTGDRSQTANLPRETGMIHPAVYIAPMAPKLWPHKVLPMMDVPPAPPNSELPSLEVPAQCRIDYRRLCEVEHNVCSRNIGMVCRESLNILEDYAAFVGLRARHPASDDSDGMDLS
ncbi:hypothetical protein BJY01DRAFT_255254 [Aspergillus pseudoustus]|uniref:DUF6590 domain-containing protein n=1 Tax=Aspergillus pseudoustus TaxID=1810923 RepID=A0ABR4INJ5_9EURO